VNHFTKARERHCFIFVSSFYWGLGAGKNAFEVVLFAYPHEQENSFPPNLPEDDNTQLTDISQGKKKKFWNFFLTLQQKVLLVRPKKHEDSVHQALLSLRQNKGHAIYLPRKTNSTGVHRNLSKGEQAFWANSWCGWHTASIQTAPENSTFSAGCPVRGQALPWAHSFDPSWAHKEAPAGPDCVSLIWQCLKLLSNVKTFK